MDPAIASQAHNVEFEITATLLPDGPPRPFSRPRRVRTEEGRAWVRSVLADLRQHGVESAHELGDGTVWARIRPGDGMRVIGQLQRHPRIERVDLSPIWIASMREGLDAAGIHHAATANYLAAFGPEFGANVDVVVIDVAFDTQHPALTNQAGIPDIREYCACGQESGAGCCPNGLAFQQGTGLGLVHPGLHPIDVDFHGTAVASVIRSAVGLNVPLGNSDPGLPFPLPGPTIHGAANNVRLHLINVQDRVPRQGFTTGWSGNQARISTPGIFEAFDRVIAWASEPGHRIRVVSTSITTNAATCAGNPEYALLQAKVQQLRDRGVLVVSASGNNIAATVLPGCIPEVTTVAATTHPARGGRGACHRQDMPPPWLTCYSTIDGNVDLAAPSDMRIATTRHFAGGGTEAVLANRSGTSFAAPLVAACAAQMAGAWPDWNPAQADTALKSTPRVSRRCKNPACTEFHEQPELQCQQALANARAGKALLAANTPGLRGAWFDDATQGQGFLVDAIHAPAPGLPPWLLFVAWYTFGSEATAGGDGQRWYVMAGRFDPTSAERAVEVEVYRPRFLTNPNFGTPLLRDQGMPNDLIGSGVWHFRSCSQAEFRLNSFELNGTGSPLPIVVSKIAASPSCTASQTLSKPAPAQCEIAYPERLTGTWQLARPVAGQPGSWEPDPAHDGRGFLMEAFPGKASSSSGLCPQGYLFVSWYDYAGTPEPLDPRLRGRWLTAQNFVEDARVPGTGGLEYCLGMSVTTGAARLAPFPDARSDPFFPTPPQCPVRLRFQDCNRATLDYVVGSAAVPGFGGIFGASGSMTIVRSVPVSGCSLP